METSAKAPIQLNKKQTIISLHEEGLTRDQIKAELETRFGPADRHAFIYKTLKTYLGSEFKMCKRGRPKKSQTVQLEIEFPSEG